MSENRRQILEMLSRGQINADEAERLIAALEKGQAASAAEEQRPKTSVKYLRVLVDSEENGKDHGPVKVNVRVPIQLLRAGVRLAGLIPARARDKVNEAFHRQGMEFDVNQIKPENLEELVEQLNDLTVDVDADDVDRNGNKVKVRVFCE
jgi:hypothetical protein